MVDILRDLLAAGERAYGVVSGSGLDLRAMFDEIHGECTFAEALGISGNGIDGHAGLFVFGRSQGRPLILQSGRIHLYEGHSPERVASTVDRLWDFGVRELILTNAVGGLDPSLVPGGLVAASEVRAWPYCHHTIPERQVPDRIVSGCDATGVYMWMHGPCYETRAEIRALQSLGAKTVGMSLPLELVQCRKRGIATGVVSCVTNDCTRTGSAVLTHREVVETAARASTRLATVLRQHVVAGPPLSVGGGEVGA